MAVYEKKREVGDSEGSVINYWMWSLRTVIGGTFWIGVLVCWRWHIIEIGPKENRV